MTTTRSNLVGGSAKVPETVATEDIVVTAKKPSKTSPANVKAGASNPDDILKAWKPIPNELSSMYSPTYFFSLYLDKDLTTEQGKGNEFVLAETGLTGMNIQEVTIDGIVGPNIRTKNAMQTNIEIKIYEPYGTQFPDLMYQAAVYQGTKNYLKAPWFLKLILKGYDENGNPVTASAGPWLWPLLILDVKSQISEAGSIHTISAMPLSDQAFTNQYSIITDTMNLSGSTVGEALKNLITQMNGNAVFNYGVTEVPFIEYAIEDRPYPYDTKVGVTRPFDHKIVSSAETLANIRSHDDFGSTNTQMTTGTDINSIVDMLMSKSDTAVQMARNSRELPPQNKPDTEDVVRAVDSIMHRIDTLVEYKGYDYTQGDYCKKITYVIKPYSSLRLLTSMGKALNFDKEKTLTKKKAAQAIDHLFMKKLYNYIFTGMNTEIEKFDISTNFNWAVSVPKLRNMAASGTSTSVDPSKSKAVNANDAAGNAQSANASRLETLAAAQAAQQRLYAAKTTAGTSADEIAAAQTAYDQAVQANQVANAASASAAIAAGKAKDAFNKDQITRAAKARKPAPIARGAGEDLIYKNANEGGNGFGGSGDGDMSYIPITITQDSDHPSKTVLQGSSNDNNQNKSVYGALLNQLYGSFDGNLQSLQLDIKGDPYWLGPGYDAAKIFDENSTDKTPNFMNGEHIFVFRAKMPLGISTSSGTVSLTTGSEASVTGRPHNGDSNIITGFYAATQVTNRFVGGKFVQTLYGTRIPGWNYENILDGRDINASETNTYSNSQGKVNKHASNTGGGGSSKRSTSLTNQQLLAATMVAEASTQGAKGMLAVGNVIQNRVSSNFGNYGSTFSGQILASSQFSAWNNTDPTTYYNNNANTSAMQQAMTISGQVLAGTAGDVTGGATSYLNVPLTKQIRGGTLPSWYYAKTVTTTIGQHTFLK